MKIGSSKYAGRIQLPWFENIFSPSNFMFEKYIFIPKWFLTKIGGVKTILGMGFTIWATHQISPFILRDNLISISILLYNHFRYLCNPELLDWTSNNLDLGCGLNQKRFWTQVDWPILFWLYFSCLILSWGRG